MRICVEFSRDGRARYVSHLDMQRAVQRWVRRAGLPAEYSQGFNPHMILSFASPMPVGLVSERECFELRLTQEMPPEDIKSALDRCAPVGLAVMRVRFLPETAKKLMAAVRYAGYRIYTEDNRRLPNPADMIYSFDVADYGYDAVLAFGGAGTLKPQAVLEELGVAGYDVVRCGLYTVEDGGLVPLFDLKQ